LFGARPLLAANTNLHAATPDNLIQVILHGIQEPADDALGYMPAFRDSLNDAQVADLVGYARELNLDDERLRGELRAHLYLARVQLNIESGLQTGVTGTPTFFINGVHYGGSLDLETMLEALKLARAA